MATTLERFSADLDRLIKEGDLLHFSMVYPLQKENFKEQATEQLGSKQKADEFIKTLPDFKIAYESWYSEALAMLRQLLPDRVANFISFYEKPKGRKSADYGSYVIQDYLQNLRVTYGGDVKVDTSAAVPQFNQQLAIVRAAKTRFKSTLFDIRQLVQADLFDSELGAANELFKGEFFRAAGVIAGVVLEKHLRQVCEDRSIAITKKNPTLSDLGELLKSNSVVDVPQWRHLGLLADYRNICAHNKSVEPTEQQVLDLLQGTAKVIKTII